VIRDNHSSSAKPELVINWFRVAVSPVEQQFPSRSFETADEARTMLKSSALHGITLHWLQEPKSNAVTLVALSGVDEQKPDWPESTFSLRQYIRLATNIVEVSLAAHFRSRPGVRACRDRWGVEAVEPDDFEHPAVRLFRGITANCQSDQDGELGVIFNWRVRGEFQLSLGDRQIASRANDAPVELRVETAGWSLAENLKRYNRRYLGRVVRIRGRNADVMTRQGEQVTVPVQYLFFEGSPERIRDYETSFMTQGRGKSAWTRMQQLSFALTPQGKRNPSIFRDRLRAITDFVGVGADFLVCDAMTYDGGQLTIDLQPRNVTAEASV
jgi:hypothetical protein